MVENDYLKTDHLIKIYGRRRVVNGVSLEIKRGEIVGLLGPNGAGKTTSFYMIVGLIKPYSGRILLNETPLTKLPMYKRAQLGISYLAQEPSIFTKLTVEENILAILQFQKLTSKERKTKLDQAMEELGVTKLAKSKAYTLSGGERRRVEIARALVNNPSFFLLDEPFAGVDPIAVEDIQRIVLELKNKNIGVLITDHNVRETLRITDHSYIMAHGEILVQGTAEELTSNEKARQFYLGANFDL